MATERLTARSAIYPMRVVRRLTGLTDRQIRYYEQTGLVVPARTPGRQRLYSQEDIERLLRVKALLAQGFTVKGIQDYFRRLEAGRQKARPGRTVPEELEESLEWRDARHFFDRALPKPAGSLYSGPVRSDLEKSKP